MKRSDNHVKGTNMKSLQLSFVFLVCLLSIPTVALKI